MSRAEQLQEAVAAVTPTLDTMLRDQVAARIYVAALEHSRAWRVMDIQYERALEAMHAADRFMSARAQYLAERGQ